MRGITEERLRELLTQLPGMDDKYSTIDYLLDLECTELTPWLPIADAPKDRPLLLLSGGTAIEGSWVYVENIWIEHWEHNEIKPTHYQELPEDPT